MKEIFNLVLIDDFKAGSVLLRNGKVIMSAGVLQPGVSQKYVNLAMNNGKVVCVKAAEEAPDADDDDTSDDGVIAELKKMKKDELLAYVEENGLEIEVDGLNKAELLEAILETFEEAPE